MTFPLAIDLMLLKPMQHDSFTPGFRLSSLDVVVLVLGVIGTATLWMFTWWWGFIVGFVIAHFFLFCNVFRLSRALELAWAGVFVILACATIVWEMPGWPITACVSLAATVAVVVLEMLKPSYHGLGWQRLNPSLPIWWESQRGGVRDHSAESDHREKS